MYVMTSDESLQDEFHFHHIWRYVVQYVDVDRIFWEVVNKSGWGFSFSRFRLCSYFNSVAQSGIFWPMRMRLDPEAICGTLISKKC